MDSSTFKLLKNNAYSDFWRSLLESSLSFEQDNNFTYAPNLPFTEQYKDRQLLGLPFPMVNGQPEFNFNNCLWWQSVLLREKPYSEIFCDKFCRQNPEITEHVIDYNGYNLEDLSRHFVRATTMHRFQIDKSAPVVQIQPDLIDALSNTRISDIEIPLSFFSMPYETFYLDLSAKPVSYGCSVNDDDNLVNIDTQLCGFFVDSSIAQPDDAHYDELLSKDTNKALIEKGIITKGESVVLLNLVFIHTYKSNKPKIQSCSFAYSDSAYCNIYELFLASMFGITDPSEVEHLEGGNEHFKTTLGMFVNLIFYINFNEPNREKIKNINGLKVELKRCRNPAKRAQLEKQIKSPQQPIVRVGKQYRLDRNLSNTANEQELGGSRARVPHIVRGHWRKQPYGSQQAREFKLLWIKPYFTGKASDINTRTSVKVQ